MCYNINVSEVFPMAFNIELFIYLLTAYILYVYIYITSNNFNLNKFQIIIKGNNHDYFFN